MTAMPPTSWITAIAAAKQAAFINRVACRLAQERQFNSSAQQLVRAIRNPFARLRKSHGLYGHNARNSTSPHSMLGLKAEMSLKKRKATASGNLSQRLSFYHKLNKVQKFAIPAFECRGVRPIKISASARIVRKEFAEK